MARKNPASNTTETDEVPIKKAILKRSARLPAQEANLSPPRPIRPRAVTYFTNASTKGRVLCGQFPFSIAVLEAVDKPLPIGIAWEVSTMPEEDAVWQLWVHGQEVVGEFVINDGAFQRLKAVPD